MRGASNRGARAPSPLLRRSLLRAATLTLTALAAIASIDAAERETVPGSCHAPNIVLILADDMGWSDLGCYGGEIETPNLDALARGGVRFTHFYNTARCCPTRAALLTGLYQHQAGIGHMTGDDGIPAYRGFLNDRCVTIAEALKPAGYATLTTGKWHVGSAPGQWPLDRGFDRFWGTPSGGGVYFKDALQIRKQVFFVRGAERIEPPDDLYVTDTFTERALEFVEEAATGSRKPFFLYLAHIAPHWPLQAKSQDITKYRGRYDVGWDVVRERRFARQKQMGLVAADAVLSPRDPQAKAWAEMPDDTRRDLAHRMEIYAAQIDCIDQNVGRLVAKLKQLGQFDDTLILFLSDNGCSAEGGPGGFSRGEPGAPIGTGLSYASVGLEWANAADAPLRKFKMDTHEGGIATPLIAHWPAGMQRERQADHATGRLVHEPGHVIDLMPTLLDVAGAEYPSDFKGRAVLPMEGRSLKPLLVGAAQDQSGADSPRALFWEHQGNKAVRLGDWKAVAQGRGDWELYDLNRDRAEMHDLAARHPQKARELAALWHAWAERCGVWEWDDLQRHRQSRRNRKDTPNVLWITSEDNSPYLGCYGDRLAHTPNLDRLAAEGVRYRNAFANAPVCSSARTTLITGMYASSLGAHNHRSRVAIPDRFLLYPEHLRAAGYYCTNNVKTDYNLANAGKPWDESSNRAHYRNRAPGQPFFAVFNHTTSHESQVAPKPGKTTFRVAPERIALPPYHPDTPDVRRDWANYYDQMTRLDQQVGERLEELQREGLADDTIVFYYADHGGALPRGKRNIHDSGTLVPLIVRFPKKWAHLAPAGPGAWVDDPVSFVDLPATVFSLCGVPIPAHYEGRPFLGEKEAPPREHVFLFRGRMDERYDMVRAVRDGRFRYVRNYSPHRPWGQHYSYPFRVLPSMRSWHAEFVAGRCNDVQARYWKPKPPEEFYEIADDRFELRNLVAEPRHAEHVARLRAALRAEILATRDAGFIAEGMIPGLAGEKTIYDYAQSDAYPLEQIVELADRASDGDPANLPALVDALDDPHPVVRYWGATGCLILRDKAAPAKERLRARLDDDWADVRVAAAEAIAHLGEQEAAIATLDAVLKGGNLHEALAAQNALDFLREAGHVTLARAQDLVRGLEFGEPADRIPRYLLELP